jgi:hypothetical protein
VRPVGLTYRPGPQRPGERAWVEDADVGIGHRDGPLGKVLEDPVERLAVQGRHGRQCALRQRQVILHGLIP